MKTNIHFLSYHAEFFLEREMFQTKVVEKIKKRTLCSVTFFETIILPVVLYGCETWPLTLREERRLRVFENRVLRRIFGPKREEVT